MDIRIAGRYKIVKKIGGGSFGRIYQGVDLISQDKVAIKIVSSTPPLPFDFPFYLGTHDGQVPASPLRS